LIRIVSIVDDFFDDISGIRQVAMSQKFIKEAGEVYNGANSPRFTADTYNIIPKVENIINRSLETHSIAGSFRLALAGAQPGNAVHTDVEKIPEHKKQPYWQLVVYLDEEPKGSLSFFTHTSGVYRAAEEGNFPISHYYDLGFWDSWLTVKTKANRAVIFPSDLYHAPGLPFGYGNSVTEGRLILWMQLRESL